MLTQSSNEKNHEDHCYNSFRISKFSTYPEKQDDNRIGILCQKFIMMFLVIAGVRFISIVVYLFI